MEIQNKHLEIYQFSIVLFGAITLIFFIYLYWYSMSLQNAILKEKKSKRLLLKKEIETVNLKLETEQLEKEKQKRIANKKLLEQAVQLKNKELATSTMLSGQHKRNLNKILEELDEIKSNMKYKEEGIKEIKKLIRSNTNLEREWDDIKLHFEKTNPKFFNTLSRLHPSITTLDHKHCAYIKMELKTKEIARLMGISSSSVQMSRVRLKKKMNLDREIDLRNYISNL